MQWLFSSEMATLAQAGSVVFGTFLAAPLLSSLSKKRRRHGFVCMAAGSLFSLMATSSAGLYVLALANAFWFFSSLRGWWLLAAETHIIQPSSEPSKPFVAAEIVSQAAETVVDAISETAKATVDAIQIDNRQPGAA